MNKYFKYLKALLYIFVPLIIFNIILSILYYFDLISNNSLTIFKLSISLLSMLIGGIYLGKKVKVKGYLEGIKIGSLVIFIFSILNIVFFRKFNIIYYLLLIIFSTLGSMIGISKRKNG